jgi:hypothetical protein
MTSFEHIAEDMDTLNHVLRKAGLNLEPAVVAQLLSVHQSRCLEAKIGIVSEELNGIAAALCDLCNTLEED